LVQDTVLVPGGLERGRAVELVFGARRRFRARGGEQAVDGLTGRFVGAFHRGEVDIGLDIVAREEEVRDLRAGLRAARPAADGVYEQRLVVAAAVAGGVPGDRGIEVPRV